MVSSLSQQLSKLTSDTTNSLNLKAQKAAHAKSLVWEAKDAAFQDFDTIYAVCHEGFQELCLLDPRFAAFGRTIFSEHSKTQDRDQMTAEENKDLDRVLNDFLELVGARLLLTPALKAVEWTVRRFRVHEFNVTSVILMFLPYHTTNIFLVLLSILPEDVPSALKFLHPYIRSLTNPPRHAIVHAATNDIRFFATLNHHVIKISEARHEYHGLLSFWAGVATEAVARMLDHARSGRERLEKTREQDVVMRILPTLSQGLSMKRVPELRVGCYMIVTVLASRSFLSDTLSVSLMEAVVSCWTRETIDPGIICLAVLAQAREKASLSPALTKALIDLDNLVPQLVLLREKFRVDKLALSLVRGLLEQTEDMNASLNLSILREILDATLLTSPQERTSLGLIFSAVRDADIRFGESESNSAFAAYADLLGYLFASESLKESVHAVSHVTNIDMDSLEIRFRRSLRPTLENKIEDGDIAMDHLVPIADNPEQLFEAALMEIPASTVDEISFLATTKSHVYASLSQTFILAVAAGKSEIYEHLPILRRVHAFDEPLYFSFFVCIWCGPYPSSVRSSALRIITKYFNTIAEPLKDVQALLPFILVALADQELKVRQEASELVATLNNCYKKIAKSRKKYDDDSLWAKEELYGPSNSTKTLDWLPSLKDVASILDLVIAKNLEECILSGTHICRVIENCLRKSTQEVAGEKSMTVHIKTAVRTALFLSLSSHAFNCSIYLVKIKILKLLNRTDRVGDIYRTDTLLPLLVSWADLSQEEVQACCSAETLKEEEVDSEMVGILSPNRKEGLLALQKILANPRVSTRVSLIKALFKRLRKMWSRMRNENQTETALFLLDTATAQTDTGTESDIVQSNAIELIRHVSLSTEILRAFLDRLLDLLRQNHEPPIKKRRISLEGEGNAKMTGTNDLESTLQKTTFILEIVEGSHPQHHQSLLGILFQVLGEMQSLKARIGSDLAYMQTLILSSLLAIVDTSRGARPAPLDQASVRVDILVDCIRSTNNTPVQNTALLIAASLAEMTPDLVLHSIMPLFTFISSTVLRNNDDYSVHVVDTAIDLIIPPLVGSLRQQKKDPVIGSSELLLSFVAAFEHMPPNRRRRLFIKLVETLGPADFMFALLAMLADRYSHDFKVVDFAIELSLHFDPEVQLASASKYFELVQDLLAPEQLISKRLLSHDRIDEKSNGQIACSLLVLLQRLLANETLVSGVRRCLKLDDTRAARIREVFSKFLAKVVKVANDPWKDVSVLLGSVLSRLLNLLSTTDFIKCLEEMLSNADATLSRKLLQAFDSRVGIEQNTQAKTISAILEFLPTLSRFITESEDISLRHLAVTCINSVSEKYGRRNIDAVRKAAELISGASCLGHEDRRLKIIGLLTLADMTEVLQAEIIPILPEAIARALQHMEESLEQSSFHANLHVAALTFVAALLKNVPWMVSGQLVDRILLLSHRSAESNIANQSDMANEVHENRSQTLKLLASRVDAKAGLLAVERTWQHAANAGSKALIEQLFFFDRVLAKQAKATIVSNSQLISKIVPMALDTRRLGFIEEIDTIEATVHDVIVRLIYKMNDVNFRPMFEHIMRWALAVSQSHPEDRVLRLISLFNFLQIFFDRLRSIVTSYASYILDVVADVLSEKTSTTENSDTLWIATARMLRVSFEHDQDDFWQSPAHFDKVVPILLSQLERTELLPAVNEIIPAITQLAVAADSAEHRKEINAAIMKYMRSNDAQVRLTAIKCEISLTARLGEEWLELLPEMLPFISELQEDDDELVERETMKWIVKIEAILGESLNSMLQ